MYNFENNEYNKFSEKEDNDVGLLLGVSVHHLCTVFQPEVMLYVSETFGDTCNYSRMITNYDIEDIMEETYGYIRERTIEEDEEYITTFSYVDTLVKKYKDTAGDNENNIPNDHVGTMTHMLSYSMEYTTIDDIISSLVAYCETYKLDVKRTYIWIDILCLNQHNLATTAIATNVNAMNQENIQTITAILQLKERIISKYPVLAIIIPSLPVYLERVSCIYELYLAIQQGKKKKERNIIKLQEQKENSSTMNGYNSTTTDDNENITIIMPPHEKQRLMNAIRHTMTSNSSTTLQDLIALVSKNKVRMEFATTLQPEEKAVIFFHLQSNSIRGTCATVNHIINSYMNTWIDTVMISETLRHTERQSKNMNTDMELAVMYNTIGMFYNNKVTSQEDVTKNTTVDYDKALYYFQCARSIQERITANTLSNMGDAMIHKGNNEKALEYHTLSLKIKQIEYGPYDPNTAISYNALSSIYYKLGQYQQSLDYGQKCFEIWNSTYGEEKTDDNNNNNNHPNNEDVSLSTKKKKNGKSSLSEKKKKGMVSSSSLSTTMNPNTKNTAMIPTSQLLLSTPTGNGRTTTTALTSPRKTNGITPAMMMPPITTNNQ